MRRTRVRLLALLVTAVLLTAGTATEGGAGSYRFRATYSVRRSDGTVLVLPVAQRCGPIHYVINPRGAPHQQWLTDTHTAVRSVARATGQCWIFDGYTSLRASNQTFDRDAKNGRVIIEFIWPPDSPPALAWGWAWRNGDVYKGGMVFVNPSRVRGLDGPQRLALLRHELGHVAGLADCYDRTQLMYGALGPVTTYQAGDRQGLAILGDRCLDR
jgi:hypothetical protein